MIAWRVYRSKVTQLSHYRYRGIIDMLLFTPCMIMCVCVHTFT